MLIHQRRRKISEEGSFDYGAGAGAAIYQFQ